MGEGSGIGWDGVEGWGENADNCNRITIKKCQKNKDRKKITVLYVKCLIQLSKDVDER